MILNLELFDQFIMILVIVQYLSKKCPFLSLSLSIKIDNKHSILYYINSRNGHYFDRYCETNCE